MSELDAAVFARYAAERACPLESPHAADLYLACACVLEVPGALQEFERAFAEGISHSIARVSDSTAFVADAGQVVREKLFAGPSRKIAQYSGRSSLRAWLSIVAVHTARSILQRRDNRGHQPLETVAEQAAEGSGLEMRYIRARYKDDVERALRIALEALSPRERALLRLHFWDGLTVDGLGAFYGVGRSTAARWLASARDALREGTARELSSRLRLTRSEYESLVGVVRGQIELSLSALLGPWDAGNGALPRRGERAR